MLRCHWGTTADGYPFQVVMAVVVSLLAPAELASQHLPGSGELGWRVPANGQAAATVAPQLTRLIAKKSPARALALSVAGTLIPIAAGAIVQANRPRGDSLSGEPAGETYDVVGGVLICVGLLVGPSLGHFYAHERGWFLPRVLVGGAVGLAVASSDWGSGAELAVLGLAAVTVMAARDIVTAPAAARRYNARRPSLTLGLDLPRGERRLGLRLGAALQL